MKKSKTNFFWISFSDLMTSLFFIVLVLFVLTYVMLKKKETELTESVVNLEQKLEVFEIVEQNLKPLKEDSLLFKYEEEHKRFVLSFDVIFESGQSKIRFGSIKNYSETSDKIEKVGQQLKTEIDRLAKKKTENSKLKSVSYLVIISGYASHLKNADRRKDYALSYDRAYNLWEYWKGIGINFEALEYKDLIDLQISGNGWGGVGRFERDRENNFAQERKNQRFIIQIVPKIGDA